MAKAKTKASKKKTTSGAASKKKVAKKAAAKPVAKKKAAAKKAVTKKTAVTKKSPTKKASAKKKPVAKKAPVKKAAAKKAPSKKAAAKKVTTKAAAKKTTSKASSAKAAGNKPITKKKIVAKTKASSKPQAKTAPAAKKKSNATPAKKAQKSKPVAVVAPKPRVLRKVVNLDEVKIALDYKPAAKEEYMCLEHLAYFRRKLETWRDELILESQETLEHLRTETRDVGDEAERASRESDNILELRTRDRYRKLLRKIEEALKRVEDGAYGFCEETGEEIGLGRLEARPIATLTVDAQERREMFQKQFRDDR